MKMTRCALIALLLIPSFVVAAGDDRRPPDADPPFVDFAVVIQSATRRERRFLVVHRVEQADDLAVNADRPWNPDFPPEGGGDPLGDAGLSVA